MLRGVKWRERVFGWLGGRWLRVGLLFLVATAILVGIYRARSNRLLKENLKATKDQQSLQGSGGTPIPLASTTKWVIVGNPDDEDMMPEGSDGSQWSPPDGILDGGGYVCGLSRVAREAGWKTIIIGHRLPCCRSPDCYNIHRSQFLKMAYKTAGSLKRILQQHSNSSSSRPYRDSPRNLAYLWAIHRGARYIFDAYVEEYQSARVPLSVFEGELSRQLGSLALDESLALVEERAKRSGHFQNPYSHFGRPDVRLLPSGSGSGSGSSDHPHVLPDFPTYRICEVRPPSIEKFLEIDEGWWDTRAPALIIPGDTMPPLCTRNTLFSPEVFWALPLLPDYSGDFNTLESTNGPTNASRIPPWYLRGLISQNLLGDLGGSIRLTLSKIPTLQLNQDFFTGGDYEPTTMGPGGLLTSSRQNPTTPSTSSGTNKLLKRWTCRSRSTYRCLLLMTRELAKSVHLHPHDLTLVESWIHDLKHIHYHEPPLLPLRRSANNPCLGQDGLHGVSFYPALHPLQYDLSDAAQERRNMTLRHIEVEREKVQHADIHPLGELASREKRETEEKETLARDLLPPSIDATYAPYDWAAYIPEEGSTSSDDQVEGGPRLTELGTGGPNSKDSYLMYKREYSGDLQMDQEDKKSKRGRPPFFYHASAETLEEGVAGFPKRVNPLVEGVGGRRGQTTSISSSRRGRAFRAFVSGVAAEKDFSEFPILKAMGETMCPGFGHLLPHPPKHPLNQTLLIIAFNNQHYDLIPTLEVMYRAVFPNILYCGNPHESVDLFLRKYQSVEERSFSFLPTYTRSTYECVLGAMEMNYDVKGYMVITDETLLLPWRLSGLDEDRVWVSSGGLTRVRPDTWRHLDPAAQKLPRLLDGLLAAWKLFQYILVGQDSLPLLDPSRTTTTTSTPPHNNNRSRRSPTSSSSSGFSGESLDAEETAYIQSQPQSRVKWTKQEADDHKNEQEQKNQTSSSSYESSSSSPVDQSNSTESGGRVGGGGISDLLLSDWHYLIDRHQNVTNLHTTTPSTSPMESDDEEVLIGDENEEEELASSSTTPLEEEPPLPEQPLPYEGEEYGEEPGQPPSSPSSNGDFGGGSSESVENRTVWPPPRTEEPTQLVTSTTPESTHTNTDSPVRVPLYHVEHLEQPTPPTWHKPDDLPTSTTPSLPSPSTQRAPPPSLPSQLLDPQTPAEEVGGPSEGSPAESLLPLLDTTSTMGTRGEDHPLTPTTNTPPPTNSFELPLLHDEVHHDVDSLLDSMRDHFLSLMSLVSEYQLNNPQEQQQSIPQPTTPKSLREEVKSHRISPREFRHIRCTMLDDGHQSELCFTLRRFLATLGGNVGGGGELLHETIPAYYIPNSLSRSFYSVANVLLHYGVSDEVALPLLFRGLKPESEWTHLKRTTNLVAQSPESESELKSKSDSELKSENESDLVWPYALHAVYSEEKTKTDFCFNFLFPLIQN